MDEALLTPEQLAKKLQVEAGTIYELTRQRSGSRSPMPKLKAGKFLRFRLSDVVKWMEENGRPKVERFIGRVHRPLRNYRRVAEIEDGKPSCPYTNAELTEVIQRSAVYVNA